MEAAPVYHCNKYSADSACEHCEGIIRHEPWCITLNANVLQAYAALLDPSALTETDRLVLHALGTSWQKTQPCKGNCGISQGEPTASIVRNP
jgi:hypothetical protein